MDRLNVFLDKFPLTKAGKIDYITLEKEEKLLTNQKNENQEVSR